MKLLAPEPEAEPPLPAEQPVDRLADRAVPSGSRGAECGDLIQLGNRISHSNRDPDPAHYRHVDHIISHVQTFARLKTPLPEQTFKSFELVLAVLITEGKAQFRGAGTVRRGSATGEQPDLKSRPQRQFHPVPVAQMKKLHLFRQPEQRSAVGQHPIHIEHNRPNRFDCFTRGNHESLSPSLKFCEFLRNPASSAHPTTPDPDADALP